MVGLTTVHFVAVVTNRSGITELLQVTDFAYPFSRTMCLEYDCATDAYRKSAADGLKPGPLLFTVLSHQFLSTDLNAPLATLSVVIFQFAVSPYS